MKTLLVLLTLVGGLALSPGQRGQGQASLVPALFPGVVGQDPPAAGASRFEAVQVYIDPHGQPLAAYQFELAATNADLEIVGLENGSHPAYPNAPYHDQQAIAKGNADRIIVADYTLDPGDQLPTARTRLCTVMVHITLPPGVAADTPVDYQLTLMTAGNPAGDKIDATLDRGENP